MQDLNKVKRHQIGSIYGTLQSTPIENPFEKGELIKAGEGSRGGKIIGHTKSGKPIYDTANHESHSNFTAADHEDAAETNRVLRVKADKAKLKYAGGSTNHNTVVAASKHHHQQFLSHIELHNKSIKKSETDTLQKSHSFPIGTIHNGYKKIKEGIWKKVSEHGMTKREHEKRSEEKYLWGDHNAQFLSDKHKEESDKLDDNDYNDVDVLGSQEKSSIFSEYSNNALTDMIINLSRYENTESDVQKVKAELERRKGLTKPKFNDFRSINDNKEDGRNARDVYNQATEDFVIKEMQSEGISNPLSDIKNKEEFEKRFNKYNKEGLEEIEKLSGNQITPFTLDDFKPFTMFGNIPKSFKDVKIPSDCFTIIDYCLPEEKRIEGYTNMYDLVKEVCTQYKASADELDGHDLSDLRIEEIRVENTSKGKEVIVEIGA